MAAPEPITVEDAVGAYLASLGGRSNATLMTYSSSLRRFEEFLDSAGLPLATTLTAHLPEDVLEQFWTWLVTVYGRDRRSTIGTYAASARAFFRFLGRYRQGPAGVSFEAQKAALSDVMGRASYKVKRVDSRIHQVVQFVEALPLPDDGPYHQRLCLLRDRAILRTLFCTGMRRAELVSLDRSDLEDGWADRALISGKGGHQRTVFFDQPTLTLIRDYLTARNDDHRPLFLRHNRRSGGSGPGGAHLRLSPQGCWLVVKTYAAQAGVPASTHDFRHAKASLLLSRGAPLELVQDLLGHASPSTTKTIYAHYSTSHLRDAFDRFSATPDEVAERLSRGQ